MAANNWSKTTQQLLPGTPGTQISFGEIRAAIGDTSKSISASEYTDKQTLMHHMILVRVNIHHHQHHIYLMF